MSRFMALYQLSQDPAVAQAFEESYRRTHLPLVAATPGLVRAEVSRVRRTVHGGPRLHLLAIMDFADPDTMATALASPEWAASGQNLASIGGLEIATMAVLDPAEVIEPATPGDD